MSFHKRVPVSKIRIHTLAIELARMHFKNSIKYFD